MRVLCDQNVDEKYTDTFRRTDWITVATVREELSAKAPDPNISKHAERHEWVIFTDDDDFPRLDHNRGLVLYIQTENPAPGDVVDALMTLNDAYDDTATIEEHVPDGWV